MFCDACGGSNREQARFCKSCGAPLEQPEGVDTESVPTREVAASVVPEAVRAALGEGYDVIRLLGQGGMGTVYLAREKALDRLVAVKVLRSELAGDERNVQRFLQEARVAARLRHPGIVSIHAVGSRDGLHYFTMDYLDGRTLDAFLRENGPAGRVAPAPARAIVTAVARAVGHAHLHDVVHRDLKPNNVMVDSSEHVFVLDFGLAKPRGSGELTTAGAVVGTPQYMSPEQIDGRPATRRSDVYALGLVYYFLLVGEHLVQGDSLSSMIAQHLSGACSARVGTDPRLPGSERATLTAMVTRDEHARPGTMEEVVRLLEASAVSPAPTGPAPEATAGAGSAGHGASPESPPAVATDDPARQQVRRRMGALLDKLGGTGKG